MVRSPRLLACWTIVLWLGIAFIFDGILSAIVLKTLQEAAGREPAARRRQRQPRDPKAPSDDEAITESLALMDKSGDYDRERGAGN